LPVHLSKGKKKEGGEIPNSVRYISPEWEKRRGELGKQVILGY